MKSLLILFLLSSCVTVKCHDADIYKVIDALIVLEAEKALLDMSAEEREDLERDKHITNKMRNLSRGY